MVANTPALSEPPCSCCPEESGFFSTSVALSWSDSARARTSRNGGLAAHARPALQTGYVAGGEAVLSLHVGLRVRGLSWGGKGAAATGTA